MRRAFVVAWAGQLVSITGTSLSQFGLQLFVFAETGSVTRLPFVALASAAPSIVLAPLAGAVVDRVDRRLAMPVANAVAGAATLALAASSAATSRSRLSASTHTQTWRCFVNRGCPWAASA